MFLKERSVVEGAKVVYTLERKPEGAHLTFFSNDAARQRLAGPLILTHAQVNDLVANLMMLQFAGMEEEDAKTGADFTMPPIGGLHL
jgi:hypothetical protein